MLNKTGRQVKDNLSSESVSQTCADIKIRSIEAIPLRVPFKRPFKFSAGSLSEAEVLVVRMQTECGIVGVGETQAWRRQGSNETLLKLVHAIKDIFAPLIVGRSPFELGAIMSSLEMALHHSLYAQAAVSDALYDIQGKALGVPVYQLLGGKSRDKLTLSTVVPIRGGIAETLDDVQRLYDEGFRTFLIKIGLDPKVDLANVRAIREMLGDDVCLRVDANASMSFDEALKLLKKLEPFDLDFAEQPISMWDLDGMAELSIRTSIPIMADESVSTDHDLINVIRYRAATGLQTKQAKNGGLWRVQRLWAIAQAAGMRIYPGNHPSLSIATAAVAHLATAWAGPIVDGVFSIGTGGEFVDDVVTHPLRPVGNLMQVPEGPGLGVEIDEDRLARLRIDI